MSQIYQAYKPLRNRLRQHNLTHSLEDLWGISRHIIDKGPAPVRTRFDLSAYIHPWDIELIARELILNAENTSSWRLNSADKIGDVINAIRRVENEIAKLEPGIDGVMNVLHRSIHRQFPWQRRNVLHELSRYMKIFGAEEVDRILRSSLDLGIREFYFLGMAVAGHLVKHFGINSDQNYSEFSISGDRAAKFFQKISSPIDELRQGFVDSQSYDEHWSYSWNPLIAKPLIALNSKTPNLLHCPIPDLVLRRISQGLYYDIYAAIGFDAAFGNAFQSYIGELSRQVFAEPRFILTPETPYTVGGDVHHGTDWILSDDSGNMFIECKTKRLRMDAKGSLESPSLAKELGVMADAIVQLYKNVREATGGLCNWKNNRLPIYPVVITMENWYLFGKPIQDQLRATVRCKLQENNLPEETTVEAMPYSVCSADEYEKIVGVIASVGINEFFGKITDKTYWGWMIQDIVRDAFPDVEFMDTHNLFADEWKTVLPEATLPEFQPM